MIEIQGLDNFIKDIDDSIQRIENAVVSIPINLKNDYMKSVPKVMRKNASSMVTQVDLGTNISEIIGSNVGKVLEERKGYVGMMFYNTSEKATYVEFGTGMVGFDSSHPNLKAYNFGGLSSRGMWEYYVETKYKKTLKDGRQGWFHKRTFQTGIPAQPFIFTTLDQMSVKLPKDVKKAYKKGLQVK